MFLSGVWVFVSLFFKLVLFSCLYFFVDYFDLKERHSFKNKFQESGFSFKNKDPKDLAEKLAYLLENPALVKNKDISAKI